jgi:hypothetical protein
VEGINVHNKPHFIFNIDETVFRLSNVPPETVTIKGVRDIIFTSGGRGKNVTIVACCSASGTLIPPFVIFKGVRFREIYKQVLPARSEIAMTDSGYINNDIFLHHLQYFQKHGLQERMGTLLVHC